MRTLIICCLLLIVFTPATFAQNWQLVWSDEFDYEGAPDPKKWDYEVGFIRNNELQYYTKDRLENARVENGTLIIESRKETYKNANYTSASLHTYNSCQILYGRIEVCAKLPTGKGMWPAIWTLGTNIRQVGWPCCGEIDIMENVGFDPHRIHVNIHTEAYNHVKQTNKGASIVVNKPYENFHLYAIEWFEDRIDFYVDTRKIFTFKNDNAGLDTWPYEDYQYLIINAAIGGSWGGSQGIDNSIFPQKYYIDYVRIYQEDFKMGAVNSENNEITHFHLLATYPNPFNATTTIQYELPQAMTTDLAIYNLMGEKINQLANMTQAPGQYRLQWNGTDQQGNLVGSGTYLVKLVVGNEVLTNKIMLLK